MDKKLVERAAAKAGIIPRHHYDETGLTVNDLCEFLARIDAERGKDAKAFLITGKDAKAFLITGTQLGMPYTDVTQRQEMIDRARSLGYEVSPLFLSAPTIPEGCWLAPNEPTSAIRECKCIADAKRESVRDALKTTIQGERNV